ncbi:hypothetical protein C7T35_35960 [Variovorax sp. WS11]|uniref:hypothetical protein n=1 Tax=Variovorax sp. WS11 TaxID=1105204 RepID=UPI000D0CC62D|nr:hypothetical protein [Variovorax sp. WS11]NDZ13967.1 hypothetical protein [Variovorax sp. WS11]PSL79715.1 hypothetical protein C7T35_35960 [Variovorax sp. WS11]
MRAASLQATPRVLHLNENHGDRSTSQAREATVRRVKLVKQPAELFNRQHARLLARRNADEVGFLNQADELKASDLFNPVPDDHAAKQQEARQAVSFGIDPEILKAQRARGEAAFSLHYGLAKQLQKKKATSKRYQKIEKTFVDRSGKLQKVFEVVRIKKTRVQRFTDWQTEAGATVQNGLIPTRVQ